MSSSMYGGIWNAVKMKTERYHELEAAQMQLRQTQEEVKQLRAALEDSLIEVWH